MIRDYSIFNQTELTANFDTGSVKHTLLLGAEVGHDGYNNQNYYRNGSCNGVALNPAAESGPRAIGAKLGVGALLTIALLFGLAFFTVHFGGFHFVHSVFLSVFFPLNPGGPVQHGFPNLTTYAEVVRRYVKFFSKYLNAPLVTEPAGQ